MKADKLDIFEKVNDELRSQIPSFLRSWLPGARFEGPDYVALNPTRSDRHLGSFRIDWRTGKFLDFATRDKGGDIISLYTYINGLSNYQAACQLANQYCNFNINNRS